MMLAWLFIFFTNDRRPMNHKASRQGDNLMKQALISMLIIAGSFTSLNGRPAPTPPTVGQPAPDFTLADLSGKSHSLKDYRGKTVDVGFISARCPISNAYKDRIRAIAGEYAKRGVAFLGVNSSA